MIYLYELSGVLTLISLYTETILLVKINPTSDSYNIVKQILPN